MYLYLVLLFLFLFFFFKQKTAYEMRISDWSSDVCSSDLPEIDPDLFGKAFELFGTPRHEHAVYRPARHFPGQRGTNALGCPRDQNPRTVSLLKLMRRSLHLLCHAPHPSCHFGSSPACGIFGLPVSRSLIIFYLQSPLRSLPDDICIEIRCVRSKCQQSAHSGRRGDSVGNRDRKSTRLNSSH